jgi:hypothetical protein
MAGKRCRWSSRGSGGERACTAPDLDRNVDLKTDVLERLKSDRYVSYWDLPRRRTSRRRRRVGIRRHKTATGDGGGDRDRRMKCRHWIGLRIEMGRRRTIRGTLRSDRCGGMPRIVGE